MVTQSMLYNKWEAGVAGLVSLVILIVTLFLMCRGSLPRLLRSEELSIADVRLCSALWSEPFVSEYIVHISEILVIASVFANAYEILYLRNSDLHYFGLAAFGLGVFGLVFIFIKMLALRVIYSRIKQFRMRRETFVKRIQSMPRIVHSQLQKIEIIRETNGVVLDYLSDVNTFELLFAALQNCPQIYITTMCIMSDDYTIISVIALALNGLSFIFRIAKPFLNRYGCAGDLIPDDIILVEALQAALKVQPVAKSPFLNAMQTVIDEDKEAKDAL